MKSEDGVCFTEIFLQDGFHFRNPSCVRFGNPKKDLENGSVNSGLLSSARAMQWGT